MQERVLRFMRAPAVHDFMMRDSKPNKSRDDSRLCTLDSARHDGSSLFPPYSVSPSPSGGSQASSNSGFLANRFRTRMISPDRKPACSSRR